MCKRLSLLVGRERKLLLALAFLVALTIALLVLAVAANLSIGFRPDALSKRPVRASAPEERFALLRGRHLRMGVAARAALHRVRRW